MQHRQRHNPALKFRIADHIGVVSAWQAVRCGLQRRTGEQKGECSCPPQAFWLQLRENPSRAASTLLNRRTGWPYCARWISLIPSGSPVTVAKFVKLLALIQIVVLLSTLLIPEGHTSVSSGGCGCSTSERTAGTCCCSTGTGSCCSVASLKADKGKPSCCQKAKAEKQTPTKSPKAQSCCSKKATGTGIRSSCPCGGTTQFAIALMPRLLAPATSNPGLTNNGSQFAAERTDAGRAKEAPTPRPPRIA